MDLAKVVSVEWWRQAGLKGLKNTLNVETASAASPLGFACLYSNDVPTSVLSPVRPEGREQGLAISI